MGLLYTLFIQSFDTSLFFIVHDVNLAANDLDNGLMETSKWALQWKMSVNHDPLKEVQEVVFSRKVFKKSIIFHYYSIIVSLTQPMGKNF